MEVNLKNPPRKNNILMLSSQKDKKLNSFLILKKWLFHQKNDFYFFPTVHLIFFLGIFFLPKAFGKKYLEENSRKYSKVQSNSDNIFKQILFSLTVNNFLTSHTKANKTKYFSSLLRNIL